MHGDIPSLTTPDAWQVFKMPSICSVTFKLVFESMLTASSLLLAMTIDIALYQVTRLTTLSLGIGRSHPYIMLFYSQHLYAS